MFSNAYLVILCWLYFLIRGKAKKHTQVNRVLVIQPAKLGDMVCTTPIFHAIKVRFPGSQVIVGGNAVNKEILRGNSDVDEYVVWQKTFWSMVKTLRQGRFDQAILTVPHFGILAELYLAGIRQIVAPRVENGFSPHQTKSLKLISNLVEIEPHRMEYYAPAEYLKLLRPLGIISTDTTKRLAIKVEAKESVESVLQKNGVLANDFLVAISPSAGNKVKVWPADKYAQLIKLIKSQWPVKVILLGAGADAEQVNKVWDLSNGMSVINSLDVFNIEELKALVARANLLIAGDTGPIYIAEAFGTPTVDIVGPIDEREQPPIDEWHKIVKLESRVRPELYVMNARVYNYEEARRQVEQIKVEAVWKIVQELLKSLGYAC